MTNASPMTDVAVVAGRLAEAQVAAVCHKPQVARKTRSPQHTFGANCSSLLCLWQMFVVFVIVVVAGTTNYIWLCASLASSDCSRPFSILTINYKKTKRRSVEGREGCGTRQ